MLVFNADKMLLVAFLGLIYFSTVVDSQIWTETGTLEYPRQWHTAVQLSNGNVLVAAGQNIIEQYYYVLSSAELYNPATGVWTGTGNLMYARYFHTATLLPNGNVLVACGSDGGVDGASLNSAEVYNAITGVWTVTGYLTYAREVHTATLLPNGNVLVAGGTTNYPVALNSAELYNLTTGVWTETGNLTYARCQHTATQLPNGNVLVAGGQDSNENAMNSAELYNAITGVWTETGNLAYARTFATATLLLNGNVLVAAGKNANSFLNSAELYNPSTGVWTLTGSLTNARYFHTATLLLNGNVLVAAGQNSNVALEGYLNSAELYNPSTGVWTVTGSLTTARILAPAALLPDGNVLVVGGEGTNNNGDSLSSAELYNPPIVSTATPTSTAAPTSIPTAATGSSTQSSLPIGAIAGIVIGVFLCLIIVIIIIALFFVRRRQNKTQKLVAESSMLEMSMSSQQGTMTSLNTQARTSFSDHTAHLHHSQAFAPVPARRPDSAGMTALDGLNNYMDDMKKKKQPHGENDTIINTLNEVSLPGFLFMSMNQLQVSDVVGEGGNGLIKRATVVDPAWKKENPKFEEVAVKFVPGASSDAEQNALNFQQEVAAMSALRFHQNIATLLGFCESPRAIILPLYQGDLHGYLHLSGSFGTRPFPWTTFAMLDIATQVAAAIMSMHTLNIVHRDIKPKNVLLEAIEPSASLSGFPFRARVCDFGISRIIDHEYHHDVKSMGLVNVFGLSTQYAAPEVFSHVQLASKGSFIDPEEEKKGDIYAFAITLWECLTEKIPYKGIGNDEINKMVTAGDRPALPEASDVADGNAEAIIRNTLADIIRSCWHQMASSRLDARKLVAQLEKLQQTLIRQPTGDNNGVLDQC